MGKRNKRRCHPKPYYKGKPLWQLLKNLPNHGVGRLIIRSSFQQDEKQPSYMRILAVDMATKTIKNPNKPNNIKIPVTVERKLRGVIFPRPVNIQSTSYLSDFMLIPETEEEKLLRNSKTASEYNYVYWSVAQKRRIRKMIAGGMSPEEAKQREKKRKAREDAEVQECAVLNRNQTNFEDNFDDYIDEEETDELCDSQNFPKEQIQKYPAFSKEKFSGQSYGSKRSCSQSSIPEEVSSAKWTKCQ
ncbi:uncharacterized protein LOC105214422 [Zeugodacus cucurbitae]|uniref:28S ribosomal protein S34, mitochondrial n=1 Tax=Zeugodacus cucurbitae TaxID=28588 RepID=A0A0A1WHB4_ZEUCU|nr:uncharacterized protein LOC105214422 [Zeugodacus cucurbitae]